MKAFIQYSHVTDTWGLKGLPENHDFYYIHRATDVAHDLLEHLNGVSSIGTFVDEFEALGVFYHYRAKNGHPSLCNPRRPYSVDEQIRADILYLFEDMVNCKDIEEIPDAPKKKKYKNTPIYYAALDTVQHLSGHLCKRTLAKIARLYIHHAFEGIKKAKKRYKNIDFFVLFDGITETVKHYLPEILSSPESSVWELSYSFSHYHVKLVEKEFAV